MSSAPSSSIFFSPQSSFSFFLSARLFLFPGNLTSNVRTGTTYSYFLLSHWFFALNPPVTLVAPNATILFLGKCSFIARTIVSVLPSSAFMHLKLTTCPTALTPLSVLAARFQCTLLKSPAFDVAIPPALTMAFSKSSSIVFAPGLRCIPW